VVGGAVVDGAVVVVGPAVVGGAVVDGAVVVVGPAVVGGAVVGGAVVGGAVVGGAVVGGVVVLWSGWRRTPSGPHHLTQATSGSAQKLGGVP
jgi:hypothetical protein